jgi:Ca-activated chloride channel family protein
MIRRLVIPCFCCALLLSAPFRILDAESARKLIREGNKAYGAAQFDAALAKYKAALQSGADPAVAAYDVGNAQYSLGQSDAAQKAYTESIRPAKPAVLSESIYNLGNSYFQGQKYSEAISAYIEALKRNPNDDDAKYNLELARRMMKQAQQKQEQQNQQQDQKDQQKSQQDSTQTQQQNQEQNKQQQQRDQQSQQQEQQNQQSQPQQQKQMTREEAERILNALQQDEQDALKDAKKVKVAARPKRERDW